MDFDGQTVPAVGSGGRDEEHTVIKNKFRTAGTNSEKEIERQKKICLTD